jgi:prepilin-type N-terminal cleavage/methylation domain-containing protein
MRHILHQKKHRGGFPGSRFWHRSFGAGQSPMPKFTTGFTLVEVLVGVAIIAFLTVTATTFQKDIFSLNFSLQSSLTAQLDARHVLKVMVAEMRKTSPSELGAYPIALASSTGITFYSDVDNNGVKDQVRYFLSGKTIRKGVTAPSGSPLTYNLANEKLTTIISDFVASSTLPLFQYYPTTYSGTGAALTVPIDIPSVRLVTINVIIDRDQNKSPIPLIVTSSVTLRNLKDNL